jgi:hypothetical protein
LPIPREGKSNLFRTRKSTGISKHFIYDSITMKLEELAQEASKLSEEERASLASRLLHGLESPVYQVTDQEVADRMREAEDDPDAWLTFDQLVSGLKRCLH